MQKAMSPIRRKAHIPRDPATVSRLMAAVRSKNNRAEIMLAKRLWALGFRYRKYRRLPGKPDLYFAAARAVVFVDGDFWHARVYVEKGNAALRHSLRTERVTWWARKLRGNAKRDKRNTKALQELGFKVIRVWEKEILKNPDVQARRIARVLERRTKQRIK
jgi:DNA mismatch endonuclease (patch repair protein)